MARRSASPQRRARKWSSSRAMSSAPHSSILLAMRCWMISMTRMLVEVPGPPLPRGLNLSRDAAARPTAEASLRTTGRESAWQSQWCFASTSAITMSKNTCVPTSTSAMVSTTSASRATPCTSRNRIVRDCRSVSAARSSSWRTLAVRTPSPRAAVPSARHMRRTVGGSTSYALAHSWAATRAHLSSGAFWLTSSSASRKMPAVSRSASARMSPRCPAARRGLLGWLAAPCVGPAPSQASCTAPR
mmetsp:Transcript_109297/g.296409  ORF Transcript_109297/g.296409 Transcript_109297/m.296409 type:complete len:245 (-) Transcript_109297:502-1236(-)